MPKAKNIIISWNIVVWWNLVVNYEYEGTNPEGNTEFQWYRNGEIIEGATTNSYTLLITDQTSTIIKEINEKLDIVMKYLLNIIQQK